jgi:hypothetical protein
MPEVTMANFEVATEQRSGEVVISREGQYTVTAKAGEIFFVGGQDYDGGCAGC